MLEHAVRERIESAAVRHGMVARIGRYTSAYGRSCDWTGFDLDLGHGVRLHADMIAATYPGRLRLAVRAANLVGPSRLQGQLASHCLVCGGHSRRGSPTHAGGATGWPVNSPAGGFGGQRRGTSRHVGSTSAVCSRCGAKAPAPRWWYRGRPRESSDGADALRFHVDIGARGARFGALADNAGDEPQLGDATDVTLRFDGALQRAEGTIEIPEVHGTLAGADLSGSIALRDIDTDPSVDLALGVRQLEFGRLLGTAGLAVPESLGMAPGGSRDLGSATIEVRVRGSPAEPAALAVSQKIDFSPPRRMPPAISRLRGDFVFHSDDGPGPHRPIDVSLSSPDFIALRDVPPLFVRTLLLPKTRASTGIAASTFANYPPRCSPTGRAGARRAARRQSPSSWPRTCSCRVTRRSDASCRNWRLRSCSSRRSARIVFSRST